MKKILTTVIVIVSQLFGLYAQVTPSNHMNLENGSVIIDAFQNVASINGSMRDSCVIWSTREQDGTYNSFLVFNHGKKTETNIQESGPKIPVYMISSYVLYPDSLVISEYKEENIVKQRYYYVVGRKTTNINYYNYQEIQNKVYIKRDKCLKRESIYDKRGRFEISLAFYNQLKNIFGNKVIYAKEEHETDNIDILLEMLYDVIYW